MSALFLALAQQEKYSRERTLQPDEQWTNPLFASLNHLMELCMWRCWVKYHMMEPHCDIQRSFSSSQGSEQRAHFWLWLQRGRTRTHAPAHCSLRSPLAGRKQNSMLYKNEMTIQCKRCFYKADCMRNPVAYTKRELELHQYWYDLRWESYCKRNTNTATLHTVKLIPTSRTWAFWKAVLWHQASQHLFFTARSNQCPKGVGPELPTQLCSQMELNKPCLIQQHNLEPQITTFSIEISVLASIHRGWRPEHFNLSPTIWEQKMSEHGSSSAGELNSPPSVRPSLVEDHTPELWYHFTRSLSPKVILG